MDFFDKRKINKSSQWLTRKQLWAEGGWGGPQSFFSECVWFHDKMCDFVITNVIMTVITCIHVTLTMEEQGTCLKQFWISFRFWLIFYTQFWLFIIITPACVSQFLKFVWVSKTRENVLTGCNTSFIFRRKNFVGIQSILLLNIIFKIKIIWVNYK